MLKTRGGADKATGGAGSNGGNITSNSRKDAIETTVVPVMLGPLAQAAIEKHMMSGPSKRILLAQTINKTNESRDAGTITGWHDCYSWK